MKIKKLLLSLTFGGTISSFVFGCAPSLLDEALNTPSVSPSKTNTPSSTSSLFDEAIKSSEPEILQSMLPNNTSQPNKEIRLRWKKDLLEDIRDNEEALFLPDFYNIALGLKNEVYISESRKVYALDGNSGNILWNFDAQSSVVAMRDVQFAKQLIVDSQGTIYVSGYDGWEYPLFALDKNGKTKWIFKDKNIRIDAIGGKIAIGIDGTIIATTWVSDQIVVGINSDGSLKWQQSAIMDHIMLGKNGDFYGYFNNGGFKSFVAISVFSSSGEIKRIMTTPEISELLLVGEDGVLYAKDNNSQTLIALAQDGTVKWKFSDPHGEKFLGGVIIGSDGTLYIGWGHNLYAINPSNGNTEWTHKLPSSITGTIVGADNALYAVQGSGMVQAFDLNGKELWSFCLEEPCSQIDGPTSAFGNVPALSKDGVLYTENNGKIYALEVHSQGLARSPYPRVGGNNQNTGRNYFK